MLRYGKKRETLTPQGDIVNNKHHATATKKSIPCGCQHSPLSDDLDRDGRSLRHFDLHYGKGNECEPKEHKEKYNSPTPPSVG